MTSAFTQRRRCSHPPVALAVAITVLAGAAGMPAAAQELPLCSEGRTSDCVLPDWSATAAGAIPSPFGEFDGIVWVDDPTVDGPTDGLDILGVGLARVEIEEPKPIRQSEDLLKLGKRKHAVPRGPAVVVRIVLDRPVDQVEGDHSSVHVVTDADGSRSNNAPTGRIDPANPFAGGQDVYSLTWASTTGKTRMLASDLAKRWYKAKQPFAAAWAEPNVLDVLIAPQGFGDGFWVVTHVAGDEGGYDSVGLGPVPIPADGRVGLAPLCVEGSIAARPFVVSRLVEGGQTLRDVNARSSWRGGVTLPLDAATREALDAFIAAADPDGDGRAQLASTVSLFEDGVVIRQRPGLELAIDGDQAHLALELGLTRRGYNVLRDIELESTGDPAVDAWLERATDALSEAMPPFRSARKGGLVAGDAIGACIPWHEAVEESEVEPSVPPTAEADAPTDDLAPPATSSNSNAGPADA